MNFWDKMESCRSLSLEKEDSRREARENYKKWVVLEKTWRQKSREIWLKKGDRNMSFFHRMVNVHRRRNPMDKIKINGRWIAEDNGIKEEVSRAFQKLLSATDEWRPNLSGLFFERLGSMEVEGWRNLLQKRRFLVLCWILTETKLQAQTVSPWLSSSFLGSSLRMS